MKDLEKAKEYLNTLGSVKPNRRTGSPGNRMATDFFAGLVNKWDYTVDTTPFSCLDYESGKISLICQGRAYEVYVSQFVPGCDGCLICEAGAQERKGICRIQDDMQRIYPKLIEADGLAFDTPVYFEMLSGLLKNFMV